MVVKLLIYLPLFKGYEIKELILWSFCFSQIHKGALSSGIQIFIAPHSDETDR